MNLLYQYRNRYISEIKIISATDPDVMLISPADGQTTLNTAWFNAMQCSIQSISLTQKSKKTTSGLIFIVNLDFSFPYFIGVELWMQRFSNLAAIQCTLNTGEIINLNTNDIALNKPMEGEFQSNLKKVGFSVEHTRFSPIVI